ncbi:MAG: hypothetical protein H0U16_13375 [Actinobacteria bacterium]|nr:hypothetical protein [Actinomycetota bacterium]
MQYTVDWKAEDLMNAAENKMIPIGYSVMNRSDHSITFSGRIASSAGDVAMTGLIGFFNFNAAMTNIVAQNTGNQDTTTILFNSTSDGKTVGSSPRFSVISSKLNPHSTAP